MAKYMYIPNIQLVYNSSHTLCEHITHKYMYSTCKKNLKKGTILGLRTLCPNVCLLFYSSILIKPPDYSQ